MFGNADELLTLLSIDISLFKSALLANSENVLIDIILLLICAYSAIF